MAISPSPAPIYSGSVRRCWPRVCRSPAAVISISSIIAGFIEGKSPIRGVASLLGDRNGGLLDRNQRQVGMSAARFITVCTVSVININWPLTVIAALSRMRAFG